MRILICRPSPYLRDELTEYFRECNWESDIASEPKAIYHSLSSKKYDLTLYYVSRLDDFAIIRYINSTYPEIQVVITADAPFEASIDNVRQGTYTALKLPYHLNQLQELLASKQAPDTPKIQKMQDK
ncbi:MAG: hypothetical protein WC176_09670 [Candidatus Cloacimonadaceae bacterium]|jgi:DNA-binding NtrC family response regulator